AFTYGGAWDGATETLTHLGAGSAHVVAMLAYAATAYLIVFVLGSVLSGIAKLPLIGIGNAVLGAAVGFAKATIFVWLVIYVALFFPLSREVRGDLHRSALVAILERPNPSIDGDLRRMMPWFVKPFAAELFARHRA
ncbi:MAG: CvpA family protein, partial [Vulcanimicrobiaceae bacterium]